jgi:TfoX/Sxy family transcriptional regulator of competence genes
MAYDEALAARVRARLAGERGLAERRMFGGLCFLVNGHMCAGIVDPPGIANGTALGHWLDMALGFVRRQPAKKKPTAKRKRKAR